jgi:pimeloyl-ACP methyl ester carboxylesterase
VAPSEDLDRTAAAFGFEREIIDGTGFRHVLFRKAGRPTGTLHVYVDGDGTPWLAGRPATDPTPRDPLMLRMMAADPAEALYLGRPCYAGTAGDAACAPRLWTRDRYSPEVVASMRAAIRAAAPGRPVGWIGYSGGGTLSLLLAARAEETRFVLTIAADLDPRLWGRAIAHENLDDSLSLAEVSVRPTIHQLHMLGAEDRVMPPLVMLPAAARLGITLAVVPNFDHSCCWERFWPATLASVDRGADQNAQLMPMTPP